MSTTIRKWSILLISLFLMISCSSKQLHQSFKLRSNYSLNGEFQISVKLPSNYYNTDKEYPVFYMLDADWFFGIATDMAYAMEMGQKDFILVGIGYGDKVACRDKRRLDLGSMLNEDGIPAYTLYKSFLKEELFPSIERRYRALSNNRTFCGWSMGAYLGNHLIYEQRDLFDNYILGGGRFPLDWSKHMKKSQKQAKSDRPISLYVGFPGNDATRDEYMAMIKSLKDEDLGDVFLHWDIYPGQGHDFESAADVITKGMDYTFASKQLTPTLMYRTQREGLDIALKHLEAWQTLRPEITDFSPHNLLDFSNYLNKDDKEKFKAWFDKKYPPHKVSFSITSTGVPQGSTIYITGSHPSLGFWNPAVTPLTQTGSTWKKCFELMMGTHLEYKFTLGSWQSEALDSKGNSLANFQLDVNKDTLISITIDQWKGVEQ